MPLPSTVKVLPLIPLSSDPLQQQALNLQVQDSKILSSHEDMVNIINQKMDEHIVVTKLEHQTVVSSDQGMGTLHQGGAMLDFKNTPQYQEFMRQKMLEMKAAHDKRVR